MHAKKLAESYYQLAEFNFHANLSYGHYDDHGGGHMSGGAKWVHGLSRDGLGFNLNHRRLRQNARKAVHENLVARSILERYTDTVADIGLRFEPAPVSNILGISAQRAERWGADVKERFHLWAESKGSSRSQTVNFYQSQRLYAMSQQRDNDIFVRLHYSDNPELLNPLQFQFIDPEQIAGDTFTSSYGHTSVKDGIVRDSAGLEKSFKIKIRKKGKIDFVSIPVKSRSGRVMMIHGFYAEYSGQQRGFPRLAHALQELQNLTDFSSAQIMKAINQSNFFMFTKPSKDSSASNPLQDYMNLDTDSHIVSDQFGAEPHPAAGAHGVTSDFVKTMKIPGVDFRQPGSHAVFGLEAGESLEPFVNTAPSESYNTFVDSFAAYLASASSMPIEVLLMRFNQNYSASRAALILFWRVANIWRNEMAIDYLRPVYFSWMSEEIAAGRIRAPGWLNPVIQAAWLNGNWYGPPVPSMEPFREARANELNVKLGAHTLDDIARTFNGSDGGSNRAKNTRQFAELPEYPL